MACRARLAGAMLAVLAAAATLGLKVGVLCYGDVCTQEMLLLNRPLSSWGLAAYILSATAFLFAPRLMLVPWIAVVFLAHGAVYLSDPVPCPVCVGTLLADGLMVILAAKAGEECRFSRAAIHTVAVALAVAVLIPSPANHGELHVPEQGVDFHGKAEGPRSERAPAQGMQAAASAAGLMELQGEEQAEFTAADLSAVAGAYSVRLLSPEGTMVSVDLRASRVVVVSPACRHCDRVVWSVSAMSERPVVVTTYPEGAADKLAAAGLSEWYVLAEEPPPGVPALIFWDGRREVVLGASAVLAALKKEQKGGA